MSKNLDIKAAAIGAGVRLYEVAERLGLREDSFSRKLRYDLPDAEREKILDAIKEIKHERESGAAS